MSYKVSRYNVCFPYEEGTYLLYNTLTNALAKLDQENYQVFTDFETGVGELAPDFLEKLEYCGFVVDEYYDEMTYIRRRMFEERFTRHSLGLTIAPTLECNFGCDYCFETGKRDGKMSDEVIAQLLGFVEKRLTSERSFVYNWMGGEPLLALDVIEKLTMGALEIAAKKEVEFSAKIITNGYLLTPAVAEKLVQDFKVDFFQITLDGMANTHNRKRPLLNGDPTFERIVQNIKDVLDIVPNLIIRVNLDHENYAEADQLMDLFDDPKYKEKVYLAFSMMNAVSAETRGRCLDLKEFTVVNQEIRRKKLARGFREHFYPIARFNPCGVTLANSLVVDSVGRIYKCWSDFGFYERSIGNISGASTAQEIQKENECLLYDPTTLPECPECKVFPLCLGGCYWKRDFTPDEPCSMSKFDLEETLKTYVQNKLYLDNQPRR